jgi:hypothetical protein
MMAKPFLSFDDLPDWGKVAAYVGIPGVIALYLVWVLASSFNAKLDAHDLEARTLAEQHAAETREGFRQLVPLLQQICANTAKTDDERAACWQVAR